MNILKDKNNNYDQAVFGLFAGSLVSLFGVFVLKWNVVDIVFLYVVEIIIIGLYTVAKIIVVDKWLSIILVPIFILIAGAFTFALVVVLGMLFTIAGAGSNNIPLDTDFFKKIYLYIPLLWPGIVSIVFSHGVSFLQNFIGKKEYLSANFNSLFLHFYKRIYLVLLIIGLATMTARTSAGFFAAVILIVAKTAVDYYSYHKQHDQQQFTEV